MVDSTNDVLYLSAEKRLKAAGMTIQFSPETKCNKIKEINVTNYLFVRT